MCVRCQLEREYRDCSFRRPPCGVDSPRSVGPTQGCQRPADFSKCVIVYLLNVTRTIFGRSKNVHEDKRHDIRKPRDVTNVFM